MTSFLQEVLLARKPFRHDTACGEWLEGPCVWMSAKSTDALPALVFFDKVRSVSLIGDAMFLQGSANHFSIEDFAGYRFDYDVTSFDSAPRQALQKVVEFLDHPDIPEEVVYVLPFSNSQFVVDLSLADPRIRVLSSELHLIQMLSYKPWVERHFACVDVPFVPWLHAFRGGPLKLPPGFAGSGRSIYRQPVESGGRGHSFALRAEEAAQGLSLVSVAPYFPDALSFNVSACVYRDGGISIHPASLQLIGIRECTSIEFGYCGNEFGHVPDYLGTDDLARVERIVVALGRKLHAFGYTGVFGADLLYADGRILVSELNPRFQASSLLAAAVLASAGLTTPHEEHVVAMLGGRPPGTGATLIDLCSLPFEVSQVFTYGSGSAYHPEPTTGSGPLPGEDVSMEVDMKLTHRRYDPNALLYRALLNRPVTVGGRALAPDVSLRVSKLTREILGEEGHAPS